ncbi:hypothetical protein [Streptomyces sp. NPDC048825]|uniref:hypothetical protein n=1 Tax=Streptomyces sp. NPDC048825 TaxID=3365592 RepID=UPI0037168B94
MRAERRHIADNDVEVAVDEVDKSELVPLLEEFVHLPRGRHRTLHLRSLLIGLHLCTQDTGGKIVLERVTDILYFRISPRLRSLLGIPEYEDHDRGFEAAYAVVRRLFHAMKDAMNPSPLPPNGHLSREEAHDLTAAADIDDLAERERRLALFTEFVLDASVRPLHNLLTELAEVSLGVDGTPIRTFPGLRQSGMAEDLLPAPQQRRGLQRLRQEPSGRRHRVRGLPPHPRHRRPNDPAHLPAGPREPPQDQEVAGHAFARRRAPPPTHPPPSSDKRTEELDPDRPPGASGIDQSAPGRCSTTKTGPTREIAHAPGACWVP